MSLKFRSLKIYIYGENQRIHLLTGKKTCFVISKGADFMLCFTAGLVSHTAGLGIGPSGLEWLRRRQMRKEFARKDRWFLADKHHTWRQNCN